MNPHVVLSTIVTVYLSGALLTWLILLYATLVTETAKRDRRTIIAGMTVSVIPLINWVFVVLFAWSVVHLTLALRKIGNARW